jgi:hypothetical protein
VLPVKFFLTLLVFFLLQTVLVADIYVADCSGSKVVVFDNGATTNAQPIRTIRHPDLDCPSGVYLYKNELYVSDYDGDIFVFLATDSGTNVTPQRTTTQSMWIEGITIYNNELFAIDTETPGRVVVFTTSNLARQREINTTLSNPTGIDIINSELFISDDTKITVYNLNDSGITTPKRTITSSTLGIDMPGGIATNSSEIFLMNDSDIRIFPLQSRDYTNPSRYIGGSLTTLTGGGLNDSFLFENELYITVSNHNSITVFNQNDSGNIEPLRRISSSSLDDPYDVFVTAPGSSSGSSSDEPEEQTPDSTDSSTGGEFTPSDGSNKSIPIAIIMYLLN